MKDKILYLKQGKKYSDKREKYFMVENWIFDEGEHINLDVYERLALIYVIRKVNKKDNSTGKGDVFYMSSEELARVCGFSIGKAKNVLKALQEQGFIKKISTGSNFTGRANQYRVMNLEPQYVDGEEIPIMDLEHILSAEEFDKLFIRSKGYAYYYKSRDYFSHRKSLPQLIDKNTGEIL